jgi:hypothetical protein
LDDKDLNTDTIDNTMEKIQDTLEDQKQVEEAINNGNQEINGEEIVNDEELENELNLLIEEKRDSVQRHVNLTQPIDTESELLRLQHVLSSLNHPSSHLPKKNKVKEVAA